MSNNKLINISLESKNSNYSICKCIFFKFILGLSIYYKISIFKSYYVVNGIYIIILTSLKKNILLSNKDLKKIYQSIIFYSLSIIINSIDYYKIKIYNNQPRNVSGLFVIFDAILNLK